MPAVNWQGFYVGGQVSYGSVTSKIAPDANSDMQAQSNFPPPAGVAYNWLSLPSAHDSRTGFGGFVGYNWQWEDVVLGLEGNYIHDGFRSTANSVRGRSITPISRSTASPIPTRW